MEEIQDQEKCRKGYGMVKDSPANRAKGVIAKPSFQLPFLPKKRVSISTINSGIKVPNSITNGYF